MTTDAPPAHEPLPDAGIIAVDLGKTRCRMRIGPALLDGPGSSGLAERDGLDHALSAVLTLADTAPQDLVRAATTLAVGAAGAASAPTRATAFAELLAARTGLDALVTSDVVTAHAGALSGRPGIVLVAGTGAVAVAVDPDGDLRRADGAGIWLGDDGSGRWIGQRGLHAVVRASDGRGPTTSLLPAAIAEFGAVAGLPSAIGSAVAPERALARFAPAVLAEAEHGDAVADGIVAAAVELLTECVVAVASGGAAGGGAGGGGTPIVVLGGLSDSSWFAARLADALHAAGVIPVDADGDALDGAALIALRPDLPHERQVSRVRHPQNH